jgi:putative ABC transport system permease protein
VYRLEGVLRSTPADVVVEWGAFGVPRNNLTEALASVRAVPGVAAVTPVLATNTIRGTLIAFDAATYRDTVPWLAPRHLGGVDPDALMAALRVRGTFSANGKMANPLGLQIGDSLLFQRAFGGDVSARLVAVVPSIPGLYFNSPEDPFRMYAYMDFGSLPPAWNASQSEGTRFLMRVASGADSAKVGDAVARSLGPFASFRTLDQNRRAELANPAANLFFGFLLSQGELAVVILVFAIGLFVFSAAAGRRDELATLVARGFRTRDVARLLTVEGWVVTILGILLGVFAALITLWTVLEIATTVSPTPTSVPYVVPATVVLPLGLVALGVFIAGWLGTVAVRKMDVVSVLKMRGG